MGHVREARWSLSRLSQECLFQASMQRPFHLYEAHLIQVWFSCGKKLQEWFQLSTDQCLLHVQGDQHSLSHHLQGWKSVLFQLAQKVEVRRCNDQSSKQGWQRGCRPGYRQGASDFWGSSCCAGHAWPCPEELWLCCSTCLQPACAADINSLCLLEAQDGVSITLQYPKH